MVIENLISVKNRKEWREWLSNNGTTEKFCWIKLSDSLLYLDAVEEALCFGWIDSTRQSGMQRFSPRRKDGNWTELNKARVRRLEKLGLMTDEGRKCMPTDPFVIHPEIMKSLKKDKEVYANFLAFPELYQRVKIDNIQSYLKANQLEIYNNRLNKFIENTKANKMYGSWNDDGRLLDY